MTSVPASASSANPAEELLPHLLYHAEQGQAQFAIWRLEGGRQALAIFTTAESAAKYRGELENPAAWKVYQPHRETLLEILAACLSAGVELAALDPEGGKARTLFDLAQVVAAAKAT